MTSDQKFAAVAFTFEAGLGLIAILLGRWFGHDPLATVDLGRPLSELLTAGLWGMAAALPLLLGLVLVDRQPGLFVEFKQSVAKVVLPLFDGLSLVEISLISAAAGVGEEILFRGLVQGGLTAWFDHPVGWLPAVLVAAIVFGICHRLNTTYAVLATVIGVYLGWLFHQTNELVVPIVAHAFYDFVAILYLRRHADRPS